MSVRKKLSVLVFALMTANQAMALNIMLTNDDGYTHPWIRTLQAALIKGGHGVTIVAPEVNQSGQSAALTMSALRSKTEDVIIKESENVYAVKGSPATSTILGVKGVMSERPDLIISGINEGANVGVLSSFSGTVGATIAALNLMGEPIPAIAISSNLLNKKEEPDSAANLEHARDISGFMVKLVDSLEKSAKNSSAILPYGIALNVNYPEAEASQVKGVGIYKHGRKIGVDFSNKGVLPTEMTEVAKHEDTTALKAGYITIVPMDGDYTAPNWNSVLPETLLEKLN